MQNLELGKWVQKTSRVITGTESINPRVYPGDQEKVCRKI
jgi:hypothetical protein